MNVKLEDKINELLEMPEDGEGQQKNQSSDKDKAAAEQNKELK